MKINYLDFRDNLFERSIDSTHAKAYVFDNFQNLSMAREYYQISFLYQQSKFLMMRDFKEKIFPSDKLILKEEKLTVLFYDLLTEEEKKMLNINNYFDAIEISNEFIKFYRDLREYNTGDISKKIRLRDWQLKKYNILQLIRDRYKSRLDELNYTDQILVLDFHNLTTDFFDDFQELVFVNIINFTPFEKELIERLEDKGIKVQLYMQLKEEDYDENNLKIKSVSLPENLNTELELYYTEEDLLQLTNMIYRLEKGKEYTILDANFTQSNYNQLVTSSKIKINKQISFSETKIFSFLDTLYNLLSNAKFAGGTMKVELSDLLTGCYRQEFRDYFDLGIETIKKLHSLAAEGFVYINSELIDNSNLPGLKGLKTILEEIEKISTLHNLKDFCQYLQQLNLEKLNDKTYQNNIDEYFDALLELYSIEEMEIVKSWEKYFNNQSKGLFLLILNYLRFKQVKEVIEDEESTGNKIKDLPGAPHLNNNRLIILNTSCGLIPSEGERGFLLTDKQRSQLGLNCISDKSLEERYSFYRHIFSSDRAIITGLKNMEGNVTTSSFVEELRLKYNLELKEMPIKSTQYSQVIESVFEDYNNVSKKDVFFRKKSPVNLYEDRLLIEKEDFSDTVYSLGYYKYRVLKDCYYKFFLEHITGLKEERVSIEREIQPLILGTLVHEIFATIIQETGFDFQAKKDLVRMIVEEKYKSYNLKVNSYYQKYYRDILLPQITESIIYFFHVMKKRVDGIRGVQTELSPSGGKDNIFYKHQITNIYLNGRIDLLIDTGDKKYIIDFKTGQGSTEQLDFYSLMLSDELTSGREIDKGIYSVIDQKFLWGRSGSETVFAEEIADIFDDFFSGEEYTAEYKSRCDRCSMIDICQVVIE